MTAHLASEKLEEMQIPLLELLEKYTLSLVDGNFLSWDGEFAHALYDTKSPEELESLEERIKQVHLQWSWHLKHLIRHPKAYTLPPIIEEIVRLEEHLEKTHRMHSTFLKIVRRENRSRRDAYSSRSRFEQKIEKARHSRREFNPHKQLKGLTYLNCLLNCVRQVVDELGTYSGRIEPIPRRVNASENDHLLVGAAVGYVLDHPSSSVALLSRDSHIPKIFNFYLKDSGKKELKARVHLYANFEAYNYVRRL